MNRPNMKTSPKAVQNYVEQLERQLEQEIADKDAQIATLTRDATVADDWRGPFVSFVGHGLDGPRVPLTRVKESVHFQPYGNDSVNIAVRWVPDDDALEIMDASHKGGAMVIEPKVANVVHVRHRAR